MAETRIVKYDGSLVSYSSWIIMTNKELSLLLRSKNLSNDLFAISQTLISEWSATTTGYLTVIGLLCYQRYFYFLILLLKRGIPSHTNLCSLLLLDMTRYNVKTANHSWFLMPLAIHQRATLLHIIKSLPPLKFNLNDDRIVLPKFCKSQFLHSFWALKSSISASVHLFICKFIKKHNHHSNHMVL